MSSPVAIVDVQYEADHARAACVVAAGWTDGTSLEERVTSISDVLPYRPGAFYERELPCLLAVLALVRTPVHTIVVDGYVDLDEQGAPGLGAHLHTHLGGAVSILGVAKTSFRGSSFATPVLRGESKTPLFVTARGLSASDAADLVRHMHGPHRIPTLLRRVDMLARGRARPIEET